MTFSYSFLSFFLSFQLSIPFLISTSLSSTYVPKNIHDDVDLELPTREKYHRFSSTVFFSSFVMLIIRIFRLFHSRHEYEKLFLTSALCLLFRLKIFHFVLNHIWYDCLKQHQHQYRILQSRYLISHQVCSLSFSPFFVLTFFFLPLHLFCLLYCFPYHSCHQFHYHFHSSSSSSPLPLPLFYPFQLLILFLHLLLYHCQNKLFYFVLLRHSLTNFEKSQNEIKLPLNTKQPVLKSRKTFLLLFSVLCTYERAQLNIVYDLISNHNLPRCPYSLCQIST